MVTIPDAGATSLAAACGVADGKELNPSSDADQLLAAKRLFMAMNLNGALSEQQQAAEVAAHIRMINGGMGCLIPADS